MGGARKIRKKWRKSDTYHYYEGGGLGHGYVREAFDPVINPKDFYYVAVVPGGRNPGSRQFRYLAEAKRFVEDRVD